MVMEAELKEPITIWQTEEKDEPSQKVCEHPLLQEAPTLENYSNVNYKAHLLIVEKYLDEGLYRNAYSYLKALNYLEIFQRDADLINFNSPPSLQDKDNLQGMKIFSGSLLAYYQFCWAYYFYSLDLEGEREQLYFDDLGTKLKTESIKRSLQHLEKAEHHLHIRLAKYFIIDEISQGILHPYFSLLAKIYFLKAKIFLFFPREAVQALKNDEDPLNDINYARISLLEKARIYAARDGDVELYSIYTAYQSWAYIIAGYLIPYHLDKIDKEFKDKNEKMKAEAQANFHWSLELMNNKNESKDTYKDKSFNWSQKLIKAALVAYESVGKKAYDIIKQKSGLQRQSSDHALDFENYTNNLEIQAIPVFNEVLELKKKQSDHESILNIDMSLLCYEHEKNDKKYKTFLFGTNACHLLFVQGVDALVSDYGNDQVKFLDGILKAYRYFLSSLAIADDSCTSEKTEEGKTRIRRNFKDGTILPEVITIRDLYPHRVSEVVAITKIYAILCNIILEKFKLKFKFELKFKFPRNNLKEERDYLLEAIHSDPQKTIHDPDIVKKQSRFNGYLATYLERVQEILKPVIEKLEQVQKILESVPVELERVQKILESVPVELEQIKKERDDLLTQIFLALEVS
jgi:hypothetical protein